MTAQLGAAGPAQAAGLVHFCGRPAGTGVSWSLNPAIKGMTPAQRLGSILWQRTLWASPVFGSSRPVVCFSECPLEHFAWLLTERGFPPWGLLFSRQDVYNLGGGPVWYARSEQYEKLNDEQRAWAVRLDAGPAGRSDWLHEREWRVPIPEGGTCLNLTVVKPYALLIGDPTWHPQAQPDPANIWSPSLPALWNEVPRYFWHPPTRQLLQA